MIFIYSIYSFQIIMAATQNIQNLCGAQKWCMLKTFLGNRTLSGINSARLMFHFQNLFSKSSNAYYCRKVAFFAKITNQQCNLKNQGTPFEILRSLSRPCPPLFQAQSNLYIP